MAGRCKKNYNDDDNDDDDDRPSTVAAAATTTTRRRPYETDSRTDLGDGEELGDDFHVGDELLVDLERRFALFARHLEKLGCAHTDTNTSE